MRAAAAAAPDYPGPPIWRVAATGRARLLRGFRPLVAMLRVRGAGKRLPDLELGATRLRLQRSAPREAVRLLHEPSWRHHRPVSVHTNYHPEKQQRMQSIFDHYHAKGGGGGGGEGDWAALTRWSGTQGTRVACERTAEW